MTDPHVPAAFLAALDQRIAHISEALDGLIDMTRCLPEDDTVAITCLCRAITAVLSELRGAETIVDTLACAVRRLAKR
jgi:hypothetical protein